MSTSSDPFLGRMTPSELVADNLPPPRIARPIDISARLHSLLGRPYTLVFVVLGVAMCVPAWWRRDLEWTKVFLPAARRLLAGQDFYKWQDGYVYPPLSALLAVPFTFLGERGARLAWSVIDYACIFPLIGLAWRVSGGRTLDAKSGLREHLVFIAGSAVALRYALNALVHTQTDLVIGALLMAGCHAATRGRHYRAAVWCGLGAAFKGPPLLFAGYLAWRRRWGAAFALVAVAVGVNLLPNLVSHSPTGNRLWLVRWAQLYAKPMGKGNVPGEWYNTPVNNQSLAGAVNRWLTTWPSTDPAGGFLVRHRPGAPSAEVLRAVNVLADGAFVAVAGLALWRRRTVDGGRLLPSDAARDAVALECGVVLALTLLLSPMSSRSHFVVLFLPAFSVARAAVTRGNRVAAVALAVAIVPSVLAIAPRSFKAFEGMILWSGLITICTSILMLACAFLLWGCGPAVRRREGAGVLSVFAASGTGENDPEPVPALVRVAAPVLQTIAEEG